MKITEKTSDCSDTIVVISQIQKCSKKRKRFTFMNITVFICSPLRPEPGSAVKWEFLFFFHISVITHLIIRLLSLSLSLTFFESISYIIWHLVVNWYYTNVFFQPLLLGAYISSHTNPLHVLSPYINEFPLWSSFFLPVSIPLAAPSSISFA